jgi:hypothetical protein
MVYNEKLRKDTAALSNAAYTNKTPEGFTKVKKYSDRRSKTYQDSEGNVFIAYRGTDPKNISDLYMDANIATNTLRQTKRYKAEEKKLKKVKKHLVNDKDIFLTGHSLGFGIGAALARDNKVTAGYGYAAGSNPYVDYKEMGKKSKSEIHTHSTLVDPISIGSAVPRDNETFHYVAKKKGKDVHTMDNYLIDDENDKLHSKETTSNGQHMIA